MDSLEYTVKKRSRNKNQQRRDKLFNYIYALIAACLALVPRLASFDYSNGIYLWAEDGNIFLNQANNLGYLAFIKEYAGYLHTYPRLVSWIAQSLDLVYQPMVLLIGWFLAYFIFIHAILIAVRQEKQTLTVLAVLALISLQPNHGEVFFNITNTQWILGSALSLYVITKDSTEPSSIFQVFLLFVLALTGPFSVIILPILSLKILVRRDWRINKSTYIPVLIGALIQIIFLMEGDRVTSGEINRDVWEWMTSIMKIYSFGANSFLAVVLAYLAWILVIYLFVLPIFSDKIFDSNHQNAAMLIACSFLMVLAGLYSHKHSPSAIVLMGSGNRYTWIPYTLVLVSIILLTKKELIIRHAILILLGIIFLENFHKVSAPNLQFEAFSKFASVDEVIIPIQPQWPAYPGWHIYQRQAPLQAAENVIAVHLIQENFISSGAVVSFKGEKISIIATNDDPILELTQPVLCEESRNVGVNIHLEREDEGWMQFFWNEVGNFNELQSLKRWYPAGEIKAQFAFKLTSNSSFVRLDPMEGSNSATISKIEIYCVR